MPKLRVIKSDSQPTKPKKVVLRIVTKAVTKVATKAVTKVATKPRQTSTKHYRDKKQRGERINCEVCGKSLASYSKNNYRVHLESHLPESERSHACHNKFCNSRFAQKSLRNNHSKKCKGIVMGKCIKVVDEETSSKARECIAKLNK